MNNDKITGNFLSAIQKYADKQKQQIESEVEQFKQAELRKAEDESLEEAYELIQKEIADKRASIKTELATKEQESRRNLFMLRKKMTSEIFDKVTKNLKNYTKTPEYNLKLLKSCDELITLFGGNNYTVFVNENDFALKDEILKHSASNVSVEIDKTIRIGGIKASCPTLNINADNTLDSLLGLQYRWFTENSTLKVV